MSKVKVDKEKVIAAAKKMVEDKKAVIAYSNGQLTKKELSEKGIKLAMPLLG
jgi:thiazole synthase ThiGH ThiG subunit